MREMIRQLLLASTRPIYQVIELQNVGRREPHGHPPGAPRTP